jgi:hypothetical protein
MPKLAVTEELRPFTLQETVTATSPDPPDHRATT